MSSAPLPTGTITRAGGAPSCSRISSADRLVAVELRRLGAVLEERQLVRRRVLARQLLRLVEVGADVAQLGPEPLEQLELGLARLLRARRPPLACPSRSAAQAVAAPWLPVEAVTTPSAPAARKLSSAGSAPRHLNAPSSCTSSRFRNSGRPSDERGRRLLERGGQVGHCRRY